MTLAEQLDGARIIKQDALRGYVLAWFGGHGIHVYDELGRDVAFWNVGSFAQDDADPQEIIDDMNEEVESGDYLNQ